MLTCDLADGEVVSSSTLGVPGRPLDTVSSPRLKVIEAHRGVGGIQLVAGAGALPDDAERVEDGMPHWGPVDKDGAVVRWGGVQLGRQDH